MAGISRDRWVSGAAGAALLSLLLAVPEPAQAGRVAIRAHLIGEARSASIVERAAARRQCRRVNGVLRCRSAAARPQVRATEPGQGYGYSYGTPRPEFYPTGTSAWWQAMEREGRTGNGPE